MTTVEAALLARETSEVSHLGCCVSARPVLKVVSSVAMVAKEWEVGRSGEPSRLMVSLLSLIVGPFLGAGVLAEVGAVAGGGPGFGGAEAFFLPFLATVAHDGAGTAGVVGGGGGNC